VDAGGAQRWLTLVAGTIALTAGCTFQYGLAYLIPALRAHGLSLEQAGILVACPTAGLLLTLVAWGAAADRFGQGLDSLADTLRPLGYQIENQLCDGGRDVYIEYGAVYRAQAN